MRTRSKFTIAIAALGLCGAFAMTTQVLADDLENPFSDFVGGLRFEGRVLAANQSKISAQIRGIVTEIRFRPGVRVKSGQLLFRLDDKRYRLEDDLARIAVQTHGDLLGQFEKQVRAQAKLVEKGHGNAAVLARMQQRLVRLRGRYETARAKAKLARMNLEATQIVAPISGIIGPPQVGVGGYVEPALGRPLAEILQVETVQVAFQVPYTLLPAFNRPFYRDFSTHRDRLEIRLTLPSGKEYQHLGRFQAIGARVDPKTNAVTIYALFDNPDGLLMPGLNVRISMATSGPARRD